MRTDRRHVGVGRASTKANLAVAHKAAMRLPPRHGRNKAASDLLGALPLQRSCGQVRPLDRRI